MLILPIKKKWYDMILSGEKKEEYREIKPYYTKRFKTAKLIYSGGDYMLYGGISHDEFWMISQLAPGSQKVMFRNGYSADSPSFIAECTLSRGSGEEEWGAEPGKEYYILAILKIQKINRNER